MAETTIESLYPLSVILFAVLMFLALRPLASRLSPRDALDAVDWRWLLVAVALVIGVTFMQRHFTDPHPHTVGRTLYNTYLGAAAKPVGFLVIHTMYYGPAVLLVVAFWRSLVAFLTRCGPGAVAVGIVFVLLGFTTESRILVNIWPLFALGVALLAEQQGWRMRQAVAFLAVSLAFSRFWLPINHGRISVAEWQEFPSQWYFMSNGPTTAASSYLIWSVVVICVGVAMWLIARSAPVARTGRVGRRQQDVWKSVRRYGGRHDHRDTHPHLCRRRRRRAGLLPGRPAVSVRGHRRWLADLQVGSERARHAPELRGSTRAGPAAPTRPSTSR